MRRELAVGLLLVAGCTSHGSSSPALVASADPTSGLISAPLPPVTAAQARAAQFDGFVIAPASAGDVARYPEAQAAARGTGDQVEVTLVRITTSTVADRLTWAVISRTVATGQDPTSPAGQVDDCHTLLPLDAATGTSLGTSRECQAYDPASDTGAGSVEDDSGALANLQKAKIRQELGLQELGQGPGLH